MLGSAHHRLRLPAAGIDRWTLGSLALAALLLMPLVSVGWMALNPTENIWPHLVRHALPLYLSNTVILTGLVALGAAIIGTGTAWLVVMTEFPGRRWLEWALLAPLAMPAYIAAYALVDALEPAGPVQTGRRTLFGWQSARGLLVPGDPVDLVGRLRAARRGGAGGARHHRGRAGPGRDPRAHAVELAAR